jgi:hypothetical protein
VPAAAVYALPMCAASLLLVVSKNGNEHANGRTAVTQTLSRPLAAFLAASRGRR